MNGIPQYTEKINEQMLLAVPRAGRDHFVRRIEMYMLIENLARDRMRQAQYDAEQARQVRQLRAHHRAQRRASRSTSGR